MSNAFGAQRVRPRDEVVIVDDSKQSRCKGQRGTGPITTSVSARESGLRRRLRKDRQQETARIVDLERAALPLRVVRV
jgi:hypothetical protein